MEIKELKGLIDENYRKLYGQNIKTITPEKLYGAISYTVREMLNEKRADFVSKVQTQKKKQVYYMSMEFLLGRSLKNNIFNMNLLNEFEGVCKLYNIPFDEICEVESDAGLGNGGLGRLAAAYMESLTNLNYPAAGFSVKYEYGIFKQKINKDGMQEEEPDNWLETGDVWLTSHEEDKFIVKFGGDVLRTWVDGRLYVEHVNAYEVEAIPYDMNVSGYHVPAVNKLRLWEAKAPQEFDMKLFFEGKYVKSLEQKVLAESICKVLYPADHHIEGKELRLKQQYFFVSASMQSIIKNHLQIYNTLDNLSDKVSIHINDTHPALCIPELMRLLMDEHGYSWNDAWKIVEKTISYTNHTVMAEALEKWPNDLFSRLLPRIFEIICEINRLFVNELNEFYPNDYGKIDYNAILANNQVKMANLCLAASHTVNGVSALHSEILKDDVFRDYYNMHPKKFTNVTNGVTYRRWLSQANPELSNLIESLIGNSFLADATNLKKLEEYADDKSVLDKILDVKRNNKIRLAKYIKEHNNVDINPDSIFDVQIKRIHEYKRQLLNAIHILDMYLELKENPSLDITPRTFIFAGKAAPSYVMAKQIIKFINCLGNVINNDETIGGKLKVVFLENYRISLSEIIIPAADVSEQISIAGKEASGTGNMKFMINGAVTMGTMDGANIEIHDMVGDENIIIFGKLTEEINEINRLGYHPQDIYNSNPRVKRIIDTLNSGIGEYKFEELASNLYNIDTYKVLLDFDSYSYAHEILDRLYKNKYEWARMSLLNTARSGFFSSDRSIKEYADRIWNLSPVKHTK